MFHTRQRHRYAADRKNSINTDAWRLFSAQDDPSLLESDPSICFFEMALAEEGTSTVIRKQSLSDAYPSADVIPSCHLGRLY